jgi:DNA-binding HxlR family transcriptional regulator
MGEAMQAEADSSPNPARVRAGGMVLSLLAAPLCVPILRAHRDGPLRLPDLRERLGGAAQTTLRGQVGNLRGIGALERHVRSAMPYTVENELTEAGEGLLGVADVVEAWLANAPQGPVAFGSETAKGAIRSLVGGWDSTVLRALADRPLSLTELNGVVSGISYPSLERRLSAMRAARQVEALPAEANQAKPYTVTEWTRQAVAPLIAAAQCECRHFAESAEAIEKIDIEAAFLLGLPLIDLEAAQSGACLLAVDTGGTEGEKEQSRLAGVHVGIENGRVTSCVTQLDSKPQTWAVGTSNAWIGAILEGRFDDLRLGGENQSLARAAVEGVHAGLAPI